MGYITPKPAVALPASKSEFPKLLCLDQQQWIFLCQAAHGRREGLPFRDALAAVEAAVASGRLVVPVLASNIYDMGRVRDRERRRRLARFMVGLSGNTSALNDQFLDQILLAQAVAAKAGRPLPHFDARAVLLGRGIGPARTGAPPKRPDIADENLRGLVEEAMTAPEVSVVELVEMEPIDFTACERAGATTLKRVRELDRSLHPDEKRRRELHNLFASGELGAFVRLLLEEYGLSVEEAFGGALGEAATLKALIEVVPGLRVVHEVALRVDRDACLPIEPNDFRDFCFLRVAVPYANLALTEARWVHLANATGLPKAWGTALRANAKDLPSHLAGMGCL
jgi:hypothetical protein